MPRAKKPNDLENIFDSPIATPETDTALTKTPESRSPSLDNIPSRAGKRGKLVYLNAPAEKQLTYIGVDHDKTQQALMIEAVNLLFEHYGKPPIA